MKSKVILLLGVGLAFISLGAQRPGPKEVARQPIEARLLLPTQGVISWSGPVVVEEMAEALVISPGVVMRSNVQAINLRFDDETVAAREATPPATELRGQAKVVYDLPSRTWTVRVQDETTGEIVDWQITRPASNNSDEEKLYRYAVMDFFAYLMSDEPSEVIAVGGNIPWTGCPAGKNCCVAGPVFAICDNGATATCVCTTNTNGTACTAKCVLIAV